MADRTIRRPFASEGKFGLNVNVRNVKQYNIQQKFSELSVGLCEELGFRPGSKRYDIVYLTCSKKLTCSQLSPPHKTNRKIKEKNELKIHREA